MENVYTLDDVLRLIGWLRYNHIGNGTLNGNIVDRDGSVISEKSVLDIFKEQTNTSGTILSTTIVDIHKISKN